MKDLKQQTKSNPMWVDEKGVNVQYMRTSECERLKEKVAYKTATKAQKLNAELTVFKKDLIADVEKVIETFKKERKLEKIGKDKGGYSFYNFDRSIKIERSNNDDIRFDDLLVAGAKEIFDIFFDENITSTNEVIKKMVLSAFTSEKGGRLNKNKIMDLISHRNDVLNKEFTRGCDMLSEAMKITGSKTYYKVSLKQEDGSYEYIKLDLSSI